ncbi:protealysin inhibitor emfourin [Arthrobacter sp. CG_A4]|uniref:protealysin inhibitor emfourin n=1 Tax=Arthrobacter sp. CG_A4 TaxID=3071706 RepID=UPI002E02568E|nr:hypothetical protein [Arthrobacter sp. CG_A4]
MKITVQRSGGIAGMKRTWSVLATPPDDRELWQPLVEACPWEDVPKNARSAATGQPDRFLYSIRAGQRRATLPEQAVTGPWRDLVDQARATAESSPAAPGGPPPSDGLLGPAG